VGDPHKLDSVRRAADNIIKEKDMIIERQKMKIIDLERLTKESESDLHKDLYCQIRDDNDALNVKLQVRTNLSGLITEISYLFDVLVNGITIFHIN
jgi:hypothetical protein